MLPWGKVIGIDAELMQLIADKYNIRLKYFEVEDQEFGRKLKSGNWTGVIKQVFEKYADVGLGHIVQTPERLESGVHFTKTIQMLRGTIICPLPGLLPRWQDFYAPFKKWIWASFAACAMLALFFSSFAQRLVLKFFMERNRVRVPRTLGKGKSPKSWFPWIHFLGPLLQRSIPLRLLPPRHGFRILFAFWALFGFLLSVLYGSLLVSRMSLPDKETPIDNVRQLVERSANWSLSTLVVQTLLNATYNVEKLLLDGNFDVGTGTSGESETVSPEFKYAFQTGRCAVSEKSRAKYVIEKNYTFVNQDNGRTQRLLRWSKDSFLLGPSSWVLRPDVDYLFRYHIDLMTARINSHGIFAEIRNRYAPERQQLRKEEEGSEGQLNALGMDSLQIVFIILMGGLSISGFVFILELSSFGGKHMKQMREFKKMIKP